MADPGHGERGLGETGRRERHHTRKGMRGPGRLTSRYTERATAPTVIDISEFLIQKQEKTG